MAGEEGLRPSQPLGGDEYVATPPEDEWPATYSANPVTNLVAYHGAQDPEDDGVPEVEVPPLGHDTRGQEDGLSGQRHPRALEHHAEEDNQVPVLRDEGEDMVYGAHLSCCPEFSARSRRDELHSSKRATTAAAQEVASG